MSMNIRATALLLAFFMVGTVLADTEADSRSTAADLAQLQDRIDEANSRAIVASLLAAEQRLAAAQFQAIDEALNAGQVDPRYLNTVRESIVVTSAVDWPEELSQEVAGFLEAAKALATALEAEDAEAAAAEAASQAHDTQQLLATEIFTYLSSKEQESTESASRTAPEVPEGAVMLELRLNEQGEAVGGAATFRVGRGDEVALAVSSATSGTLDVHGYDRELELRASEQSVLVFTADATGRYPLEVHPTGADEGVVVSYLEVRPR